MNKRLQSGEIGRIDALIYPLTKRKGAHYTLTVDIHFSICYN